MPDIPGGSQGPNPSAIRTIRVIPSHPWLLPQATKVGLDFSGSAGKRPSEFLPQIEVCRYNMLIPNMLYFNIRGNPQQFSQTAENKSSKGSEGDPAGRRLASVPCPSYEITFQSHGSQPIVRPDLARRLCLPPGAPWNLLK